MRDRASLKKAWDECRPEIVFHLAAQPIVRESYRDPISTLETNFMGTANVLEMARIFGEPVSAVVVSSDKCYENREWIYGYREEDPMGGHDIYSMSKGATELLVSSYRRSFFSPEKDRSAWRCCGHSARRQRDRRRRLGGRSNCARLCAVFVRRTNY